MIVKADSETALQNKDVDALDHIPFPASHVFASLRGDTCPIFFHTISSPKPSCAYFLRRDLEG